MVNELNYNPLLALSGIGSMGDVETAQREEKEKQARIKADPRYPQWLAEVQALAAKREIAQATYIKKVQDAKRELLERYATKNIGGKQ